MPLYEKSDSVCSYLADLDTARALCGELSLGETAEDAILAAEEAGLGCVVVVVRTAEGGENG